MMMLLLLLLLLFLLEIRDGKSTCKLLVENTESTQSEVDRPSPAKNPADRDG
jgi:hypothetical protein